MSRAITLSTVLMLLVVASPMHGASISTLFNSGVNGSGGALPDNAADPHYTITAGPVTTGPLVHTSAGGFPVPPWLGDQPTSAWISPTASTSAPAGTYTYATTFDLAGFDPSTARITGRWAADDGGGASDIRINGVSTGIANTTGFGGFSPTFTINSGFVSGVNTIEFDVTNGGANPTGLRTDLFGEATTEGRVLISDLFNTGVSASQASLPNDAADPHYTITAGPVTGTPLVHDSSGGFPVPPWAGDDALSAWIAPTANTSTPAGTYTYSTTFTLDPNASVNSAEITGLWAVDDANVQSMILLNGTPVVTGQSSGFGSFEAFSIAAGSPFVVGVNTLEFVVVNNSSGPGGLRVNDLTGSFGFVPEPATATLGLMGIAGLVMRRRKAA